VPLHGPPAAFPVAHAPLPSPITLRGQWSGWLHCDAGTPRVELLRKLAAYGLLRIVSDPKRGWTWTVERAEKWFSEPGADTGTATTLVKALEAGLARAMGLLGEACSVRDSHRRGALDEAWGKEHPVKAAKEAGDPTVWLAGARSVKGAGVTAVGAASAEQDEALMAAFWGGDC